MSLDDTLGWEFTHEVAGLGECTTYAFRPGHGDLAPYDFAVLVGFDRKFHAKSAGLLPDLAISIGEGIAMSKVLFGTWKNEIVEYRYRLNDIHEPSGTVESPPDFQTIKYMLLDVVPTDVVYSLEVGTAPPIPPCGRRRL